MGSFGVYEWLQIISLGGLLGACGQGARVIVGVKKLNDAANSQSKGGEIVAVSDLVSTSRMLVSLAIGFIAGAFAAVATFGANDLGAISGQKIAALAAAGYAGADFIEGFISRTASAGGTAAGEGAIGVGEIRGVASDGGALG